MTNLPKLKGSAAIMLVVLMAAAVDGAEKRATRFPPRRPFACRPCSHTTPAPKQPQPAPADCFAPMATLLPCGMFLTASSPESPSNTSDCCVGLSQLLNVTGASADENIRCICPFLTGAAKINPARMMLLTVECGVELPPAAVFACFAGGAAGGQPLPNPAPAPRRSPTTWSNPEFGPQH